MTCLVVEASLRRVINSAEYDFCCVESAIEGMVYIA